MYCGMSLGRVGLDFRGLLVPVFEQEVLRLFSSSVKVRSAPLHGSTLLLTVFPPGVGVRLTPSSSNRASVSAGPHTGGPAASPRFGLVHACPHFRLQVHE